MINQNIKLKLKLLNDPYCPYGILTEDHSKEIETLGLFFKTDEYNKLYNDCLIAIIKKIYKGQIYESKGVLEVKLNPDYIREMTRNDLQIIARVQHKLSADISYGNICNYYSEDLYPLPSIEKLNRNELNAISDKSYPMTHFQFFKYEDFDVFNWTVYYRYMSNKYKKKFNKDPVPIEIINTEYLRFNKLILELKYAFNRLRPFQSSYIENIPIKSYITYAGQSPAIPSGHSFQGFLFGALAYNHLREYFLSLDQNEYKYHMRLLVRIVKDTGHRRIMAGVHYPSDMMASWLIFKIVVKFLNIDNNITEYKKALFDELSNY